MLGSADCIISIMSIISLPSKGKQDGASGYYSLPNIPPQSRQNCVHNGCSLWYWIIHIYNNDVHNWSFMCPKHWHTHEAADVTNALVYAIRISEGEYWVHIKGHFIEKVTLASGSTITDHVEAILGTMDL